MSKKSTDETLRKCAQGYIAKLPRPGRYDSLFDLPEIQLSTYRRLFPPEEAETMIMTIIDNWIDSDLVAYLGMTVGGPARDILKQHIKDSFWHWRPAAFALFTHQVATGKLEKVYGNMTPVALMQRMTEFNEQMLSHAGMKSEDVHRHRKGEENTDFRLRKNNDLIGNLDVVADAWKIKDPDTSGGEVAVPAIRNTILHNRKRQ